MSTVGNGVKAITELSNLPISILIGLILAYQVWSGIANHRGHPQLDLLD